MALRDRGIVRCFGPGSGGAFNGLRSDNCLVGTCRDIASKKCGDQRVAPGVTGIGSREDILEGRIGSQTPHLEDLGFSALL